MKIIYLLLIILSGAISHADDNFEFHGYWRSGIGQTTDSADYICVKSPYTNGNHMRLGNECGHWGEYQIIYSTETAFQNSQPKDKTWAQFVFGQTFETSDHTNNETPTTNIASNYVRIGGFSRSSHKFWVGKRYYRNADSHILYWFYYADMSGVGAGVEDIQLGENTMLKTALLRETSNATTDTNRGKIGKTVLDIQTYNTSLGSSWRMGTWLALATTPSATDASNNIYKSQNGVAIGALFTHSLPSNGFLNLSLQYGSKNMQKLTMAYDDAIEGSDQVSEAQRIRLMQDMVLVVDEKMDWHLSTGYESYELGPDNKKKVNNWVIATRPVYFFSDNFSLALEAGVTNVKVDTESENRTLGRITLAPQIHLVKGIWGRPVLRAFITHSSWSNSNKDSVDTALQTKTSVTNVGFQMETWF